MKLGQEVVFKNDFNIETMITKNTIEVKNGDKAIATRCGFRIITGKARGKITNYTDEKVEGYDYENISKLILKRLNCVYNLEEFMEYEEISFSEMVSEIEDVLTDIF